jgi:hypothetical protein
VVTGGDGTMTIQGVNEEESMTRRFESSKGGTGAKCGDGGQNQYRWPRPCCRRRTMKELGQLIGGKAEPLGQLRRKSKENVFGPQGEAGPKALDLFQIGIKALSSKSKVLNIFKSTFKRNLDWNQTKINLNKLFDYFANLELLEIDLNIQIQTKA